MGRASRSLIEILVHFSASTYKRSGSPSPLGYLTPRASSSLREESGVSRKGDEKQVELGTENVAWDGRRLRAIATLGTLALARGSTFPGPRRWHNDS